jgi:protein phosphatase
MNQTSSGVLDHDSPTEILGRSPESSPAKPLAVRAHGLTHPGKVRPANEDQFLVAELTKAMLLLHSSLSQSQVQQGQERGHLFIVADGVGGHAGGQRASALAVRSIENFVLNSLKWFFELKGAEENAVLAEFRTALKQADTRLFEDAAQHPELSGMGTTLTLAYSLDRELFVAHVGDSRCYLMRAGVLHRLTHDHTMLEEMLRSGHLKPKDVEGNYLRHVVTNIVGGHTPGVKIEVKKVTLEAGDLVLLCSDGLTEMLADSEIAAILKEKPEPEAACQRLVDRANEQGGRDNVTVIVAAYG